MLASNPLAGFTNIYIDAATSLKISRFHHQT